MKLQELTNTLINESYTFNLLLQFENSAFRVHTNEEQIITTLSDYFAEWVINDCDLAITDVYAYNQETPEFGFDYTEYRESPEKRIKEIFFDEDDIRVVKKTKTGVHFIISPENWIAVGPLLANTNQLINYINAIFMELQLDDNSLLFHAAGISKNGKGLVIAAPSGKGKSTTALNLMNHGLDFVSNDRVIIRNNTGDFSMIGVPKHPRVNPGTLLNNDKVKYLLREPERFDGMSREEIWNIEEKYDAVIPDCYGSEKFQLKAEAKGLLIIDWENSNEDTVIEELDLTSRMDLLPAIMKKPSLMTPRKHDEKKNITDKEYVDFLKDLPVYILKGNKDPETGQTLVMDKFFRD
jgi:HprK-related kinase B